MGKPYPVEVRKRVVATVENGGLSCNQAAKQFGIGISTVIGWMNRLRTTGSVAPGQMGEGDFRRAPCLALTANPEWRLHLAGACRGTRRAWAEGRLPLGVGVRPRREAQLQKKAWWLANGIVPTSRAGERNG
jgi:transposase-like protein